jgi:hypothetical protein
VSGGGSKQYTVDGRREKAVGTRCQGLGALDGHKAEAGRRRLNTSTKGRAVVLKRSIT